MSSSTDRIEKRVLLDAPLERVWRAVSNAEEFGRWFGVRFDQPFAPGALVTGQMVPTLVDREVAAGQKPYEGLRIEFQIERIEPMRRFSFRWHPYAVDPDVDYSGEPTTLVVFDLQETAAGVRLTVTESGFDRIPLARRARAFEMNEKGWAAQVNLIAKYLASGE